MTMRIEIGSIAALYRYPVKSMRGEALEHAALGWHGLEGDRRYALRRLDEHGDFPWLSASRLPELVLYAPVPADAEESLPTHVRTPDGADLILTGTRLAADIASRYGRPVEMMQSRHGVFDDACVSIISATTVSEIGRISGTPADVRRFRPNILIRPTRATPFAEDQWLGGTLTFGDAEAAPVVSVTRPDVRCAMMNIDPDDASHTPEVLKAVVRANRNIAGVYGTVTRAGRLAVGQSIFLQPR